MAFPFSNNSNHISANKTNWLMTLLSLLIIGILFLILLGLVNEKIGIAEGIAAAFLISGASMSTGGFLGFLFGIPRAKQIGVAPVGSEDSGVREYLENTNLEQISDWLTKIIVGVTLVQFGPIKDLIVSMGQSFGPSLIDAPAGTQTSLGVSVILYYLILGFLFAYLWTRIYMEHVLRAQRAASNRDINDILKRHAEQTGNADAEALEMVNAFLDKDTDPSSENFMDIREKVASSSIIARSLIFDKAKKIRSETWRNPKTRPMMERTIPIFEGLIDADPDQYHTNYGQLGYALTDSKDPNWSKAQSILEKAIKLRGDGNVTGKGYYEFSLARALINQDKNFNKKQPSDNETASRIRANLKIADQALPIDDDPGIKSWLKINGK